MCSLRLNTIRGIISHEITPLVHIFIETNLIAIDNLQSIKTFEIQSYFNIFLFTTKTTLYNNLYYHLHCKITATLLPLKTYLYKIKNDISYIQC